MTPVTQTVLADPARADGHDADGNPGNCTQAAIASILDFSLHEVPHFIQYVDWFGNLRHWLRERDLDITYYPLDEEYATTVGMEVEPWQAAWQRVQAWSREMWENGQEPYVLLSGPSPRGPFGHVVVGTAHDLTVRWDPHPSRAGLTSIWDAFVLLAPYDPPPPPRKELTA